MGLLKDEIESIKASVSIVRFLRDEGIYAADKTETQIRCFNHEELRPSARVYSVSNTVYCWVCNRVFDVVSAYMVIHEVTINIAVKDLITKYGVKVEERPQQIRDFYKHAQQYSSPTPVQLDPLIVEIGKSFQEFYEAVRGYKHIINVIDDLWGEYDALLMSDDPQRLERATRWFESACSFVRGYIQHCNDLETVKERAKAKGLQ